MLRIDIPELEISPETERTLRRLAVSRGIPGGEKNDKFLARPDLDNSYILSLWPAQLMEAVKAAYLLGIGHQMKSTARATRRRSGKIIGTCKG